MIPVVKFGSKLGLQCTEQPRRIIPILQRLKDKGVIVPGVKSILNGGVMLDTQHISPSTFRVLRLYTKVFDNELQALPGQPESTFPDLARRIIDLVFATWSQTEIAAADQIELINEMDPPQVHGWQALFKFLTVLMQEAGRRGLHIATPGCAYGTPEYSEWEDIVQNTQFFPVMKAGGHFLSIHEGELPGSNDPIILSTGPGVVPGAPDIHKPAGAHCGRYRFLYEGLLKPRDLVVPLIVSELVVGGGFNDANWETIWKWMTVYDRLAREDYYVVVVTPFILSEPGNQWPDYSPIWDDPRTDAYYVAEKDKANALPDSTPTPPPLGYTHLVYNCQALNVREFPWAGRITPAVRRVVAAGTPVNVYGVYQDHDMRYGWACLSDDGNEWVSAYYLRPV